MKGKIWFRHFGECPEGDVQKVTITDGQGMYAEILTLGATLRRLVVPDRKDQATDVVLGYDMVEEYLAGNAYLGATIGRFANRIGGSEAVIDGTSCRLSANEGDNQLHGGPGGFHSRLWTAIPLEKKAIFRLSSPDGDQGYPGNLQAEVVYSMEEPGTLRITYEACSDRDTIVSLTNHSYFNLNGSGRGDVAAHTLKLAAAHYTPTGGNMIPTGDILPLAGTALDLQTPRKLGEFFDKGAFEATRGLDHNFVLSGQSPAAVLESAESGIRMTVETDRPGLQVYTAGFLAPQKGKDGALYGPHSGVALETQAFPDAMHHANFPDCVLKAGELYHTETSFRFTTDRN